MISWGIHRKYLAVLMIIFIISAGCGKHITRSSARTSTTSPSPSFASSSPYQQASYSSSSSEDPADLILKENDANSQPSPMNLPAAIETLTDAELLSTPQEATQASSRSPSASSAPTVQQTEDHSSLSKTNDTLLASEDKGKPDFLEDVYFAYDSWRLTDEAKHALHVNAAWLKAHPQQRITIEGHCDARGTQAYNYVLGEKRAAIVKQYLSYLGVPSRQLEIISYGKEKPVCHSFAESCFRRNRRAHFTPQVTVASQFVQHPGDP
ncbi:MAG: hypothetical protein D6704_00975 [Nitrospirae bacterium]|nr:MAG: hypothetical protein D6704_00975 [Nitrospirota bacterium]